MPQRDRKPLVEACRQSGVRREIFLEFVRREWIHPSGDDLWSEEDITRAHLILELQQDFGVNDEAVPIILHLLDQLLELHALFGSSHQHH
jgi:chaperone modulatory protein CbpM